MRQIHKKLRIKIFFMLFFFFIHNTFQFCQKQDDDVLMNFSFSNAGLMELGLWDPPADAVFIDPDYKGVTSDGSFEMPYKNFKQFQWESNTVYALKRNTSIEIDYLVLEKDSITLASYGEGKRPIIHCTTSSHGLSTHYLGNVGTIIRDIEVEVPKGTSCLIIRDNSQNISVLNCKLSDAIWGLRALNNINGLFIFNCEISNSKDDGIFIKQTENIEISNCYIHDVNMNWQPPSTPESEAGGDGIQFEKCNKWHVHHNYIDRSATGNKFCFISNNPYQDQGIFEFNYTRGPKVDGSSVYFLDGKDLIIRYNYFEGPSNSPVYTHSSNILIHNNIFANLNGPIIASKTARVYNNTFYNISLAVQGGTIEVVNNIFDLNKASRSAFKISDLTESHNLFVFNVTIGSFEGLPAFIDPLKGNFRLSASSDAIDKGKVVGIKFDLDGNPIPNGSAPEIGPYEFY